MLGGLDPHPNGNPSRCGGMGSRLPEIPMHTKVAAWQLDMFDAPPTPVVRVQAKPEPLPDPKYWSEAVTSKMVDALISLATDSRRGDNMPESLMDCATLFSERLNNRKNLDLDDYRATLGWVMEFWNGALPYRFVCQINWRRPRDPAKRSIEQSVAQARHGRSALRQLRHLAIRRRCGHINLLDVCLARSLASTHHSRALSPYKRTRILSSSDKAVPTSVISLSRENPCSFVMKAASWCSSGQRLTSHSRPRRPVSSSFPHCRRTGKWCANMAERSPMRLLRRLEQRSFTTLPQAKGKVVLRLPQSLQIHRID